MTTHRHSATVQRVLFPADNHAASLYVRELRGDVTWERSLLRLGERSAASLATYFGAFPAGRWLRTGQAGDVVLTGRVQGALTLNLSVRSSTGVRVESLNLADGPFTSRIALTDGDEWVWVDVETHDGAATLAKLAWQLDEADMGSTAVCITTHNRPTDCLGVLQAIADDPGLAVVSHVLVVDQGVQRVRDADGFAAVEAALDGRLRVIEQANLGGSGGFSRGMLEAESLDVDYAVLLDDDVRLEPESLRRMIALAARSAQPVVVGAHMLDLLDPTRLHSWGERVDRSRFEWAPIAPGVDDLHLDDVDVTRMRSDAPVEFNGWWMCLIPVSAVRELGASMPYFIKWDDTEFSLRAAAAGIETVTLPGAALWHLPWTGKDDGLDWQAYFQLRNRVVTALIHGGKRSVLRASLALDVNHILCMQYGSAAARRLALSDILTGPAHLDMTLTTRIDDVRALMTRSGQVVSGEGHGGPLDGAAPAKPHGFVSTIGRLVRVLGHQLRRSRAADPMRVDVHLSRSEGKWWALGLLDSAAVDSATGRGAFICRRDRRTATALLRDAVVVRARLWLAWRRLSQAYGSAAPQLASRTAWNVRFDATPQQRPSRG